MNEEVVQKPMTMLRDEFLQDILSVCNNSSLPYFVIEYLLKDIIADVHTASIRQQQVNKESYEKRMLSQRQKEQHGVVEEDAHI